MAGPRKEARLDRPSKPNTRPKTTPKKKPRQDADEKRTPDRKPRSPPKRSQPVNPKSNRSSQTSSNVLSIDSLAKLDALNEKSAQVRPKEKVLGVEVRQKEKVVTGRVVKDRGKHRRKTDVRRSGRVVSGAILEEGRGRRGGYVNTEKRRFGKGCWIAIGVVLLLLVIFIPVGVVLANKKGGGGSDSGGGGGGATTQSDPPPNSNLATINQSSIPTAAKGSVLDPFTWYDTADFNVTYTNTTVGGLPIMGLNSTWDDTAKANGNVPALNETWAYGTMPIRGINLGGWLSIEPFITPSMFNSYEASEGIVDEYTLTQHLGASQAATTLEKHYDTFITEQSFSDIQAAGMDHVRIPYSYWAITTYPGDPYVPKISWRYLLRGIEWARKYGLRVNLDLHAVPGSQNGWNHSGRQGAIDWLNGTDGDLNGQRSLDLHNQISAFFAQPRYQNVIAIYGLVNEPKMTALPVDSVLAWTTSAIDIVRKNGVQQTIAFGDGFLGLPNWKGKLQGITGLVMDAHQYVIFNTAQLAYTHQTKIQFACSGWSSQMSASINVQTGFGPTLCGEWSQADTDCATYLNNVNVGSRWTGTMNTGNPLTQILTPTCPANSGNCECTDANADPAQYSNEYKQWLLMNAEAQMTSFEIGWGWFYWTWITETAVQWSWKGGMAAGILPNKVWERGFNCSQSVPDFKGEGLAENY